MSSLASVEVAHSPEQSIGPIQQDLTNLDIVRHVDTSLMRVMRHLPAEDIMVSPRGAGVPHELHRIEGVGALHAVYLGFLAGPYKLGRLFHDATPHDRYQGIRVIAEDEGGIGALRQDFALDYHFRPRLLTPTSTEEVGNNRYEYECLVFTLKALHDAYLRRVPGKSNVISLVQQMQNRSPE